jgi:hypothetical protein
VEDLSKKTLAIDGQCAQNRWPVAGAKKADAIFSDHPQQPADVEACSEQDRMERTGPHANCRQLIP